MKRRRRARVRRRNPAGGFLPGVLGFLVVPLAGGVLLRVAHEVTKRGDGSSPVVTVGGTGLAYLATAVASWAGSGSVKDPGWSSFLFGGAVGSAVSAIFVPWSVASLNAWAASAALPAAEVEAQ